MPTTEDALQFLQNLARKKEEAESNCNLLGTRNQKVLNQDKIGLDMFDVLFESISNQILVAGCSQRTRSTEQLCWSKIGPGKKCKCGADVLQVTVLQKKSRDQGCKRSPTTAVLPAEEHKQRAKPKGGKKEGQLY
ncbi:hypothetical protein OsI_33357 [Oryza sativa Indica Group]|uniref:Uncharacterized protein n=1 Tax=Oryza sativa subsp. indica TaxID=39946 RepID=A2Z6S6_ORYSI|nr:hypothetical protein OsI_33357 [Oryza sativa Indica Group]